MYLVLASKSPRRREILMNAGYNIRISASNVDETVIETIPEEKVFAIAKKKGLDVYENFKNDSNAVILSADTIVVINNEILGKPKDKQHAREMISKLQGKIHSVYTAVFIKSNEFEDGFVEKTDVSVSPMTEDEIEKYINSKEPYDKAGGYAIQGIFSQYISSINGDYYNVMGLPINKVKQVLSKYDFADKLECPKCKNEVKENDKFCLKCGTKLNIIKKNKVCSKCHKTNNNSSKYCEFCGNDLSDSISYIYNDNECPICHHINKEGIEYCESCGTILKLNEEAKKELAIQKEDQSKKDHSETAFIMGIISICTFFFVGPLISPIFSIIAIIYGSIEVKRGRREKALTGLIMGIATLVVNVLTILVIVIIFITMFDLFTGTEGIYFNLI